MRRRERVGGGQRGGGDRRVGGVDLDGGYQNRLEVVFSALPAPSDSGQGLGGASTQRARAR